MKKYLLTLITAIMCMLLLAVFVSAETYTVSSNDEYADVYENAISGDTIMVDSKLTCDIYANKSITYVLKAETTGGSISTEITVYNENISDITLTVAYSSATVWGYVSVENRDESTERRIWVDVTIYNADGVAVAQTKSDKDGKYQFNNLPLGEYNMVAQVEEMRRLEVRKLDFIEDYTGTKVGIVSVGPDRNQTFAREKIWK